MKHGDIISTLSVWEKCSLLTGKSFWMTRDIPSKGVPQIMLSDGPHGVRRQEGAGDQLGLGKSLKATCFPTAATMANSWDIALGEQVGECLGEEAASQSVGVLLGPGLNIKRNPLCGRNFEYFSEDPVLAGKMAAAYVRGIQKNGISACPKHFAANNMELRRQASDSVVDERTLRELYLTGFEIAVREGHPKCIMSAYNRVNGVYANENPHLLQEILRDEWGFDGFVVSDWGANNDFVEGVRAGSHLEMPSTGGDSAEQLERAIEAGRITVEEVDRRVDELLDVVLAVAPAVEAASGKDFDIEAHHRVAMKASEESIVLLKNEEGILPLSPGERVAVIGEFAQNPRYQGAGSSVVSPTKLDSVMDVIGDFPLEVVGYEPGYPRTGPRDLKFQSAAVELARQADTVLLYLGLDEVSESEGIDRANMRLPNSQIDLLKAVSAVNRRVVVIMAAGSAVEMPWLGRCRALVHGYLCGQAGATALLKVIMGDVNPSGRLSETYPMAYKDVPSSRWFPEDSRTVEYREGLYVGYRYFETAKKPVLFPFGFGLSYTTFEYSDLILTPHGACFTLTNTGERDGAEVAQLYVHAVNPGVYRPAKELKGFTKVFLKAGEKREITIDLDERAFRYFNVETGTFENDGGQYEVTVGSNVRDERLSGVLAVPRSEPPEGFGPDRLPHYWSADVRDEPDSEFETLLGRPIPDGSWSKKIGMNDDIGQLYRARSLKARLIGKAIRHRLDKTVAAGMPDLNTIFVCNLPFRAIGKMTGGMVSQEMCESLLKIVNGHALGFFAGAGGLIAGFFRQKKRVKRDREIR